MTSERPIRVGIVGSGFMAQQHSAAYRLLPNLLGESVPLVALVRMAGGRRIHELGPPKPTCTLSSQAVRPATFG
jgi:hypothetical protein